MKNKSTMTDASKENDNVVKTFNANRNKNRSNKSGRSNGKSSIHDKIVKCQSKIHNDPSWYSSNPQLLKDVASLSFSDMLGNGVNTGVTSRDELIIPGIMRIDCEPSLGCGKVATDAPTVAARNFYSYIRHANSGSANYDAPDLFMMLAAYASAVSLIEEAKRAYGVFRHYSTRNRYYGKCLVDNMGYNYNSIETDLPGFRAAINLASAKLNTIKIPASMALLERWKFISTNLIVDTAGSKPQTYYTRFDSFLKFSGYSSETGTELLRVPRPNSGFTVSSFRDFITDLVDALFFEEDVGIMSGDILKAYGDSVYTIMPIAEDYVVLPDINDDVRHQFHNAYTFTDSANPILSHTIKQENGVIVETLTGRSRADKTEYGNGAYAKAYASTNASNARILNYYKDTVTPEDVMVGTRLSGGFVEEVEDSSPYYVFSMRDCGTEVVTRFSVCDTPTIGAGTIGYATQVYANQNFPWTLTMFDWHPHFYIYSDTQGVEFLGLIGDVENYTSIDTNTLANINKIAVISEVNISAKTNLK